MVFLVCLVLFFAMTARSSATYCICKDGVSESALQKNIDYACGAGADCSAISQNGACYNPNTAKDHCNYAVNSYFQRKGQATGSCDFAGTATVVASITSQNSACVFPSSPSTTGTSTTPPTTGTATPTTPITTPSTGTTTPITTPSTGTTTPSTGINTTPTTSTTPSTGTTTTPPSVFGLGPTGSGGISSTDSKATVTHPQNSLLFWSFTLTLLLSGSMLLRL